MVDKSVVRDLLAGQLAKEHLHNVLAKETKRKRKNNTPNKIIQKYREIKGSIARRQMKADDDDAAKVVNMREKREQAP